jgi:hypothetical protein
MTVRVRPKADIQLSFQFAWLPHGIDNQRLVVRDYAESVESAAEIFNQGKDNISPMWPNEILCCLANSNLRNQDAQNRSTERR